MLYCSSSSNVYLEVHLDGRLRVANFLLSVRWVVQYGYKGLDIMLCLQFFFHFYCPLFLFNFFPVSVSTKTGEILKH